MAEEQLPHLLVFPYPAQGHLLPLLDLAHLVSLRGLSITVVVTSSSDLSLLSTIPSLSPLFLPFPTATPRNFLSAMISIRSLHRPLVLWAQSHPNPPVAILSDFFLGWTNQLAGELNIPRLVFCPSGAFTLSVVHCLWRLRPKRSNEADDRFPISFPQIPGHPAFPWCQLSPIYRSYKEGDPASETIRDDFLGNIASWGYVFNTFDDLEGKYLAHLKKDLGHSRVWAVGPLAASTLRAEEDASELMRWLDARPGGSVVYVCFGSLTELTAEQAAAVAEGLEKSGVQFLWAGKGTPAPEGFEERVKDRGVLVKGWAPQVAVLRHRAVGAFVTHCGWNSVLEGLVGGVVMVTWPMSADQFIDDRLLREETGVVLPVCEGRDAVPEPEAFARAVAEAVAPGRPERTKVAELRKKAVEAVGESGSSFRDLEELGKAIVNLMVTQESAALRR